MPTIPQLMLELGRARAAGPLASGQVWGQGIARLGDLVQQARQQGIQERALAAQQQYRNAELTLAQNRDAREAAADTRAATEFAANQQYTAAQHAIALHDYSVQTLGSVLDAPDAQKPALWSATRAGLIARGIAKPEEIPDAYPGDQAVRGEMNALLSAKDRLTLDKPIIVGDGQTAINPRTREIIATGPAKRPNSQESTFLYKGKVVKGDYLPGANGQPGKYFYNGQDVTGQVSDKPPAAVQVINAIGNGESSATAKAIADYRIPPPSPRTLATPVGEKLMADVMALNPSYDSTQYPTRQKMRAAFTSGSQAQTINSLNTAIGHLDQFTNVIQAMGNGSFRPGNAAYNWFRTTFGNSAATNFQGIKSIMSGELASAFKKSGATDQEIASVEAAVNGSNSEQQLLDYVQKIALPALGSKVVSFADQYHQVMGADDPFRILLPESEAILTKYGIDPRHPQIGGGTTPPAAGPQVGSTVTLKSGQTVVIKKINPDGTFEY